MLITFWAASRPSLALWGAQAHTMADALPEHVPRKDPESPTLQEGDGADDAANPAIADGDAPTGVSILRGER